MKIKHILAGLLCCTGMVLAAAQTFPVYQMSSAPKIDGKLDDRVWQNLPEARGFRYLGTNAGYVKGRLTTFKMGKKDGFLYLAVNCLEPDLKGLKAVETYRDGWSFDDAVETFFLVPGSKRGFFQMLANAKGARWCRFEKDTRETEPPSDWQVASGRTACGWTLEMAIPLKMLGAADTDGLKFNIGRNIPSGGRGETICCWAKVVRGYGDAPRFAVLQKRPFNGPADIPLANNLINTEYDLWTYLALREIGVGGKVWKNVEALYSASEGFGVVRDLQKQIAKKWSRYTPEERPAVYNQWLDTVKKVSTPARKLSFRTGWENKPGTVLMVDGTKVDPVNGAYTFTLKEGVTTLALSVNAKYGDSLKFDFKEFPELNTRWSYKANPAPGWEKTNYQDKDWQEYKGTLPAGKVGLRQVIIWNNGHDGRFRCINPSIKVWGFSKDSVETVYHSIYSPTGNKVNSYKFVFTLPPNFRLLDMEPGAGRNRLSLAPSDVKVERSEKGDKYTLTYKPSDVHEWQTADSLIAIYRNKDGAVGEKGVIPYARLINNNITEVGGALPYEVLPEINGRILKSMIMSYYMGSMPQGLSKEVVDAVVRDSVRCGVDHFAVYPAKSYKADSIVKHGGQLMMGYLNHPIWGSKLANGAVTQLFRDHPELFCIYYNGKQYKTPETKGIPAHKQEIQFCPTLAAGKYKKEFYDAVQKDHRDFFFKDYPDAKYVFLNWEQDPWMNSIYAKATNPVNAFCFCPLCKENFRKWAKLPAGTDLSNRTIFTKYYEEWRKFRYTQDAQLHTIVNKAISDLGKTVFFYSWSNHFGYWEAAKDIPYHIFLGCPGNGTANARSQHDMDEYMEFHMKKLGRRNITGQRFIFFPQTYGWNTTRKEGWLKFNVMSEDGYLHPRTWKWQTVRMIATMQGGYDLQNPLELTGGIKYYVGEATRMIAEYEKIFHDGVRNDKLAKSKEIAYPDMLVLTLGNERLVLLFNESDKPKTVTVENLGLRGGEKAYLYYQKKGFYDVKKITVTIPADDVEVLYIRGSLNSIEGKK